MTFSDIVGSLAGWIVILGVALWYVRRVKHPSRGLASAFGIFVGIFGGITLGALILVVTAWYAFGMQAQKPPGSVGALLVIAAVIPAWRFAVRRIRSPVP
jgi:hypothetical protein